MSASDGTVHGIATVADHGDPALRWNLVILGDGYQQSEIAKYAADVDAFVRTFERTPPFDELFPGINVFRIDVTSAESGAADPTACGGSGAHPRTFFDASFCTNGIRRLLVVNASTVHAVVNQHMPQAHMIMVMVNSTVYGGSGGGVATFSLAPDAQEIALHEMGHTAFGFADEYESYAGREPTQPNITANANAASIKWRTLVTPGTRIPTTSNANCAECDPQPNPFPATTVRRVRRRRFLPLPPIPPAVHLPHARARERLLRGLPQRDSLRHRTARAAAGETRGSGPGAPGTYRARAAAVTNDYQRASCVIWIRLPQPSFSMAIVEAVTSVGGIVNSPPRALMRS